MYLENLGNVNSLTDSTISLSQPLPLQLQVCLKWMGAFVHSFLTEAVAFRPAVSLSRCLSV